MQMGLKKVPLPRRHQPLCAVPLLVCRYRAVQYPFVHILVGVVQWSAGLRGASPQRVVVPVQAFLVHLPVACVPATISHEGTNLKCGAGTTCLLFHLEFHAFSFFILEAILDVCKLLLGAFQDLSFFLGCLKLFYAAPQVLAGECRSREQMSKSRKCDTFSMFVRTVIFAWRSLDFASCMARVFLSSMAVAPIVVMLRLILSGLWTILPLVRCMLSKKSDVSEFMFSFFKMRPAFSTLSASMSFDTA